MGKSPLITRILLTSLILVISITGVFTVLIVRSEFEKEREAVDVEIERIVATFRPIASRSAYELDESLAQQVVDSILSANYVVGAKIVDEFDQALASKARYFEVDSDYLLEWALIDHEKTFEYPLLLSDPFDPERVKRYGKLEISVNLLAAMEDFATRNRDLLYLGLSLVFVFSVALLSTFELMLSRPLRQIVRQLSGSSDNRLVQVERKNRDDELAILVRAINSGIQKERLKAAELAESEARMNQILEGAGDACFLFDTPSARIVYANRQAAELLDYSGEQVLTKTAFDIVEGLTTEEWRLRLDFADQLPSHLREASFVRSDGQIVPVENNTTRIQVGDEERLLIFARDLTSRKRLEENFAHAQRLSALGELTGGVAHDFNNALQVLKGSVDVLTSGQVEPRHQEVKMAAESALGQAESLIKQLLAFSRKQVLEPEKVDLGRIFQKATPLFEQAVGPHQLVIDIQAEPLWVKIDVNALNNAIVNLLVNARHAMELPGTIQISVGVPDLAIAARHLTAQELRSNYMCLSVSDSGTGIKPEDLRRIFEPYFTTKSAEQGTGLGLSMVYGFVSQVGGKIEVESTLGVGTTFYLYLPMEETELDQAGSAKTRYKRDSSEKLASPSNQNGGGVPHRAILLVDDNDDVRFISKAYLQSAGFQVIECRNGQEAIEVLDADAAQLSAVITDMIMPGEVGGKALIEHARVVAPSLPIGVVSGYSDELLEMNAAGQAVRLLSKPFSKQQMIEFAMDLIPQDG